MTVIADIILKLKSMIKKEIVKNHGLSTFIIFSKINSFAYINSNMISNIQKDFHQDNLSLFCLQCHKHNCIKIFSDSISRPIQVKNRNDC